MKKESNNIPFLFKEICATYSQRKAIIFKQNQNYRFLTYHQLYQRIIGIAGLLMKNGIKKPDKVTIILENSPLWPQAFLGVLHIGAVTVPLNPHLEYEEVLNCIFHSESKCILTSSSLYPKVREIVKDFEIKIITLDSEEIAKEIEECSQQEVEQETILPDDLASIVYTSGTTSFPKGVMLTHKNLLSNVTSLKSLNLINSNDCFVAILPFYHTYPLTTNLLLPLLSGVKISFPSYIDSGEILECIRYTDVTILVGVPRIFSLFYERIKNNINSLSFIKKSILQILLTLSLPLRRYLNINLAKSLLGDLHKKFGTNFRFMFSGGAKLNPEIAQAFYKWGFTILEGYGLTETSPVVSFNLPNSFKIGSVGKPLPGVKVTIDNPDKTGVGEILIKGENVSPGYYKSEELTQKAIKDNFFLSGDLGFIDKDGFLYITGRKKEMIVLSSGKKINPQDLESYYGRSPFIEEICIFLSQTGQSKEVLSAVILPNYKYFRLQQESRIKDRIRWEIERLSTTLPPYKRIKNYTIINESLPKTVLGKIKRYEVERKYAGSIPLQEKPKKILPQDMALLSWPVCKKALDYFSRKLKRVIHLDDHLELDLGLDSLEQISLFLELQQVTGTRLEELEFFDVFTVRDVLGKLKTASETTLKKGEVLHWKEIFKAPLKKEIKESIALNQSFLAKSINIILAIIFKIIARCLFLLTVKGEENIPKKGPFILCPNHSSYLDGPILAISLPFSILLQTYFVGYAIYFNHPILSWAKRLLRLIPIDPASNLPASLRVCSFVLANSKVICMFPEGVRSLDGQIQEFKRGVGILIEELGAEVIPVYIQGTYDAWPAFQAFPKPKRVKITFGRKLSPKELTIRKQKEVDIYKNIVDNLRNELLKLKELSK
jgi:long-chain acyl-CoA synthetase